MALSVGMEYSLDSFGSTDGDTFVSRGGRSSVKSQVAARMAELERQGRLVSSQERATAAGRRKASLVQSMSQATKCSRQFRKLEMFRQTQRLTLPAVCEARPLSRGDLAIGLAVRAGVTLEQLRRLKGALDRSAPHQDAVTLEAGLDRDGSEVDGDGVAVDGCGSGGGLASEAGSDGIDAWVGMEAAKRDSLEAACLGGSADVELARAVNNKLLASLAEKVANDACHSSKGHKGDARAVYARVVVALERREELQRRRGGGGLELRESLSPKAMRSASFALSARKRHVNAIAAAEQPDSPATDYQRHLEDIVHERFFATGKAKLTAQQIARPKAALDEMRRKAVGGRDLEAGDPEAEQFAAFSHWDLWDGCKRGVRAAGALESSPQPAAQRAALDGAQAEETIHTRSARARHSHHEVHGYRTIEKDGKWGGRVPMPQLWPTGGQSQAVYTQGRVALEQDQLAQLVDDDFHSQVYKHSDHPITEHQKRKMVCTSVQLTRHVSDDMHTLDMRHLGLGDTAAALLANVVQAHARCAELRRIDFSHNSLSDAGFAALNTVLKAKVLPNLEVLDLSHNQLTVSSLELISESVMSFSVRGMAGTLAELDLSHNPIWDEGAVHLCGALGENICRMSRVSLAACGLTDLACKAIGEMLGVAIFLKQLDFSWNALGIGRNDHISHLGAGIASNASLTSLNLSNCGLHSQACIGALARGIRHNECLEELSLDGNAIDKEGALEIAAALSANSRLRRLSMQHNPVKHGGGVALIAAMLRSPAMELVNLKYCALIDLPAPGRGAQEEPVSLNAASAGETRSSTETRTDASGQAVAGPASWQAAARAMLERAPLPPASPSCPLGVPMLSDRRFHLLWQGMDMHTLSCEWAQQYVGALAHAAWFTAAQCATVVADLARIHGHESCFRSAVQLVPRVPDMWTLLLHRTKAHSAAVLQRLLEAHALPSHRFAIGSATHSYAFNLGLQAHRTAAQYLLHLNCVWRQRLEIHGLLTRGDARTAGVYTAVRNLEYCAHPRHPSGVKVGDDAAVASRHGESARGRRSGAGERSPWADLTALGDSHSWVRGGLDAPVQLPNCGWLKFDFVAFMGGPQWQVLKSPVHLLGQAPQLPVQWRGIDVFRVDAARARSQLVRPPPSPRFVSVASRAASHLAADRLRGSPTLDAKQTAGAADAAALLGSSSVFVGSTAWQGPAHTSGHPVVSQGTPVTPAAGQSPSRPSSKGSWSVASGAMVPLGTAPDVPPLTCAPMRPLPVHVRRLMSTQAWIDAVINMNQSAGWRELTRQNWGDLQTKKTWWDVKAVIECTGLNHGLLACVASTLDHESASTGGHALRSVPDGFASRGAAADHDVSIAIDNPDEQVDLLLSAPPEHLAASLFLQTLLLRVLDEVSFTEGEWLPSGFECPHRAAFARPPTAGRPRTTPEPANPASEAARASPVTAPPNGAAKPRTPPPQPPGKGAALLSVAEDRAWAASEAPPPPDAPKLSSCDPVSAMAAATTVHDLRTALQQVAARNWDRACTLTHEAMECVDRAWDVVAMDVPSGCEVAKAGDEAAHVYLVLYGSGVVSAPLADGKATQTYGVAAGDMVGEMAALLWVPAAQGKDQAAAGAGGAPSVNGGTEAATTESQPTTVPAGCTLRSVTQMRLLACPVKQVRSLSSLFPALLTRLRVCAEVRGVYTVPLPVRSRETALKDAAAVTQQQTSPPPDIPGARSPQSSSPEAPVTACVDTACVDTPMWKLLPVVCYGAVGKGSKAGKAKQAKARNKKLPRGERKGAWELAALAAGTTQLEACPAPLSAGSPQSARQPPSAVGGGLWTRKTPRHARWMEQLTGRALEVARRYGASCELSVSEVIALMDGDDLKRWPALVRVQLVLALFDCIRLDDLPNFTCLLARLSPFEQGLLGHKLGWAAILDPFRGMGVHVSLRLEDVQDHTTLLRVLKIQSKLDLALGGASSAKVLHVRVNGHLTGPLGQLQEGWPARIRVHDALRYLDWPAYQALQRQLRQAVARKGAKESRSVRARMAELVKQAKRKSAEFARPTNLVELELASLTDDEVRQVAAVTITAAFRANMQRLRFIKLRRSVLRLQRACLGMLLRRWERQFRAYLSDEEVSLINGVGQAARCKAAFEKARMKDLQEALEEEVGKTNEMIQKLEGRLHDSSPPGQGVQAAPVLLTSGRELLAELANRKERLNLLMTLTDNSASQKYIRTANHLSSKALGVKQALLELKLTESTPERFGLKPVAHTVAPHCTYGDPNLGDSDRQFQRATGPVAVGSDDAGPAVALSAKPADAVRELWHRDYEALMARAQQLVGRMKTLAFQEMVLMAHYFATRSTGIAKKKLKLSELLYHWTSPELRSGSADNEHTRL